jgi:hypothetical protein
MSFLAKRKIHILNGVLLILPLLAWNVIFTARLTQEGFTSDANVPAWILVAETFLRIIVFVFPLFLPLGLKDGRQRMGFAVYLFGLILYVGSSIPLPGIPRFCVVQHHCWYPGALPDNADHLRGYWNDRGLRSLHYYRDCFHCVTHHAWYIQFVVY